MANVPRYSPYVGTLPGGAGTTVHKTWRFLPFVMLWHGDAPNSQCLLGFFCYAGYHAHVAGAPLARRCLRAAEWLAMQGNETQQRACLHVRRHHINRTAMGPAFCGPQSAPTCITLRRARAGRHMPPSSLFLSFAVDSPFSSSKPPLRPRTFFCHPHCALQQQLCGSSSLRFVTLHHRFVRMPSLYIVRLLRSLAVWACLHGHVHIAVCRLALALAGHFAQESNQATWRRQQVIYGYLSAPCHFDVAIGYALTHRSLCHQRRSAIVFVVVQHGESTVGAFLTAKHSLV